MVYGVRMLCCMNVQGKFGTQIFINVATPVPFGVLETIAVTHWGFATSILGEYNQQHCQSVWRWSSLLSLIFIANGQLQLQLHVLGIFTTAKVSCML